VIKIGDLEGKVNAKHGERKKIKECNECNFGDNNSETGILQHSVSK